MLAGLALFALLLVALPLFQGQFAELSQRVPAALDLLQTRFLPWLQQTLGIHIDPNLDALKTWLTEQATQSGATWLPTLQTGALAVVGVLANLLLIPVVMFYLLKDWDVMVARVAALTPRPWMGAATRIARAMDAVVGEFLRGQLAVMATLSLYYAIALWAVGLDYALPIGILTGVLSFVPFLGFGLGMILALLVALLQFADWTGVAWVAGIYLAGQVLESYVITPRLVGERVGLHPVAVIFALAAFGQLFGFVGVLLAVPLAAVLLVALRELRGAYEASAFYRGGYNAGSLDSASARHVRTAASNPASPPCRWSTRGKVRDIYAVGDDKLLIVTTDRLSAFDVVMPTPIPGKGEVLTKVSAFWFDKLKAIVPNQALDIAPESVVAANERDQVAGRAIVVRKLKALPVEAIVRGYLVGSGWKEYQASQSVCGIALPAGLQQADRLPEPIFTPSTKAAVGAHDENIAFEQMAELIGADLAQQVRDVSLALYQGCGRVRAHTRHHHRRHQVRVRSRRSRQAGVDRRGADPGFVALLAGRPVPAGQQPAQLRQAVRARLAGSQRLEQAGAGAGAAGRNRRQDRRQVPRGDDAAAGLNVFFRRRTRSNTKKKRAASCGTRAASRAFVLFVDAYFNVAFRKSATAATISASCPL